MVNFVHNWWVYGLPNGVARYGCYWITLHVWIKPILYFFSFVQTIFVARRSEPVSCLFCNIDIDIQNSHILTEIRFPRPIVFRWCITPYCLPLKSTKFDGNMFGLAFFHPSGTSLVKHWGKTSWDSEAHEVLITKTSHNHWTNRLIVNQSINQSINQSSNHIHTLPPKFNDDP